MKSKHPKVVERKLGREQAFGLAWEERGLMEIDPRQNAKDYTDTLIHEWFHLEFPEWGERKIAAKSKKLAAFLWKMNHRPIRK